MTTTLQSPPVAKKRADDEGRPKRYGTQIRVTEEFAQAITKAAHMEGLSVADFAAEHLMPVVESRYRDAVLSEAKRLKGGPGPG